MTTTTTWTSQTGLGNFLDASNWSNGAPTAGDLAIIHYGQPTLDNAGIDGMTIDLVSAQTLEASLGLSNVTLGSGVLLEDLSTTNGASVLAAGTITNDGTLLFNGVLGGIYNGFSFDFSGASAELVNNGGITIDHSDGLFLGNGDGGTVVNNSTIDDQSTRLFFDAPVTGTGVIEVAGSGGAGAAVDFTAPVGPGQTIAFGDALSTVTLDAGKLMGTSGFQGTITGFRTGDAIDVPNSDFYASGSGYNATTRTLTIATLNGTLTIHLGGTANYYDTFSTKSDNNGGFEVLTSVTTAGGGAGSTTTTVLGGDNVTRTLTFSTASLASRASALLGALNTAETLFIDNAGSATMQAGYTGLVDDASGAVSAVGSGAANETVVAGAGNFNFTSGGGSGTIVTGGGNDFLFLPTGGNWSMALGAGADTVVAVAGIDTITTGSSGALVFLGAGASSVDSLGADTIVGQSGGANVLAAKSNALVFSLGGPLSFTGGSGADTVVAGAVATTLTGGGGTMLAFTDGDTTYQGGAGSDTVVGLSGSLTVQAGTGGDVVFGGFAGHNSITSGMAGTLTAYGEGAGDVIMAQGAATVAAAAGAGAETLTGAGSSGTLAFFGGAGVDLLAGGSGNTALVAGFGGGTLAGGSGATLFEFADGITHGADIITGWNAAKDYLELTGYAVNNSGVLANATIANGSTSFSLSDGTQVTLVGVTDPTTINFYTPAPTTKM